MSDLNLQHLLRENGLGDEPPLATKFENVVTAGRRAVLRRRVRTATRGGIVAAALASVAVVSLGSGGTPLSAMPAAAQDVVDNFDPATFPDLVDGEIRDASGAAIPQGVRGRIEPTVDGYIRLKPADYRYTDSWNASYELGSGDQLMVVLRKDLAGTEGDAEKACDQRLADGTVEQCSVDTLDNGTVSTTSVYAVAGGFARQVVNERDYGFVVTARETVQAADLSAAEAAWTIDEDALVKIASSDRLVYAEPTGPTACEAPTYVLPTNPDKLAQVDCNL